MSRLGRAQPVPPFATHGFVGNTPANGVLPGRVTVVENDDRRRKTPPPPPVVINGLNAVVTVAFVAPPQPVLAQPPARPRPLTLQPTVTHGFLGNTPANGTLPPPSTTVDRADQRARFLPLPATVISPAQAATATAPAVLPPAPVVVPLLEQRARRDTPVPIVVKGSLAFVQPPASPPPPTVVPLQERRRVQQPPVELTGFDDVTAPAPTIVPADDRRIRFRPLDPFTSSGTLPEIPPTFVPPPGPFVVPIEERRYILDRLRQPTSTHGFLGNTPANGVLPPPGLSLDRVDQRVRYLPQPTLALSGVLAPFIPPPPVTVNAGTDWAAEMSTW